MLRTGRELNVYTATERVTLRRQLTALSLEESMKKCMFQV